ncbi:MAG: MotA/TolQ/ExbB proton channel family protein [Verrucomicrobiota bacterium]
MSMFLGPELFAEEAAAEGDESRSLLDKIIAGGGFMIPIGILSIASITLYVFNALQLSKGKFLPKRLASDIYGLMQSVHVRSAIDTAAQHSSFYGRMMATALPHVDATDYETLGREKVEDSIAEFTVRETSGQMVWVQYLSVVAQMAPMMGLMGTVWGMVGAFEALGTSKGAEPAKLASQISIALMTTLGGLVIALPSIFGYYLFKNALAARIREVHQAASDAIDAAIAAVNADAQLAKVPEGLADESAAV